MLSHMTDHPEKSIALAFKGWNTVYACFIIWNKNDMMIAYYMQEDRSC